MDDVSAEGVWTFGFWGDFTAWSPDGLNVTPRGRKARALLAWLALHPSRPVSRERLCGLLWGDRAEEQARGSLRQTLFELKAFTSGPRPLLRADRSHVTLDALRLATDLAAVLEPAGGAPPPRHDERFLADLDDIDEAFDDWLRVERARQRPRGDAPPAPHRFLPPAQPAPAPVAPPAATPHVRQRGWRRIALAGALLGALLVAAFLLLRPASAPAPLAIAVLPFRDLSASPRPFFAEGVSEEILNRLARNPGLKVMGRTSAASLRDERLAPAEIGRRLGVDYLVEGSVRTNADQVRVDAALVRASDGTRLWSQQVEGARGDIFAMQDKIGAGVARQLNLAPGVTPEAAIRARGEAYALYLEARSMLHDATPATHAPAVALLNAALKQDPDFAPAWAALGLAETLPIWNHWRGPGPDSEKAGAIALAQRALRLDPDLPLAHLVLGKALPTRAERRGHLETVLRLTPNDSEAWIELALLYAQEGNYPAALDACRRAVAIDPLWWVAFFSAAQHAWDMGYREESEAYVRRIEVGGAPLPFQAYMVRADKAWRRADFSGQIASNAKAWRVATPKDRVFAEGGIVRSLRSAGLFDAAAMRWRQYPVDPAMVAMWKGVAPDPATVRAMASDPAALWGNWPRAYFLIATLLRAGRSAEIPPLFDARYASPAAMEAAMGPNAMFVWQAVLLSRAFAEAGRAAEAREFLARANAADRAIRARGRFPNWYEPIRAALYAANGDSGAAVAALEGGIARGWFYPGLMSFADMAQDPSFAPLLGNPRFERVRASQKALAAREAREIAALPLDPALAARFGLKNPPI